MIYYLTCFGLSSFLLWFGQKLKHGQCELFRWFIYGIALLIPITLAGIRDWSVGLDVLVYGYEVFKDACTAPYIEGMDAMWDGWIGEGYLWLNFIVSRITDNFNVMLFVIMLIEVLFVFFTIYQWKDKFPIWLGMFVFYTFMFNTSLNAMRQFLALAIAYYGMKYIFRRSFIRFAIWVLLGSLFHTSAIIALLYYPLFWYANKFTSNKSKILFSLAFLSLIIFSNEILISSLYAVSDFVPFASRAAGYLSFAEKSNVPYKNFVYFCFLVILFLYNRKSIMAQFSDIGHFLEIAVISVAIIQLVNFVGGDWAFRFIYVANWWLCLLIPIAFYSCRGIQKIYANLMFLFYCLVYWYVNFIHIGYHDTKDYSTVLNWF